jgi:hypothetical protein
MIEKTCHPRKELKSLVAYAKDKGLELFLGCDANSHNEVWGSTNIRPRGESLLDFIMRTGLHILNRGKASLLGLKKTRSAGYYIMYEGFGGSGEGLEGL